MFGRFRNMDRSYRCQRSFIVFTRVSLGVLIFRYNSFDILRITQQVDNLYQRFLKQRENLEGRGVWLTHMVLSSFTGQPCLALLKDYWLRHYKIRTCFHDLRRLVAQLPAEEQQDFHSYISHWAKELKPVEGHSEV